MKVEIVTPSVSLMEDLDYRQFVEICIDGDTFASFWDGEPEDNNLSRNFSDVNRIDELMKLAYEAGRCGEGFEVVNRETDEL